VQVASGVDQDQFFLVLLKQGPGDPMSDKTAGARYKKTHSLFPKSCDAVDAL
jgi:hypothetical protein